MELPIEPKDSPWSGEDKGGAKEVKKYIYKWEIFNDQNILLIDCKVNFLRHVKK